MSISVDALQSVLAKARQEISRIIIGQKEVIDQCLIVIMTGQHALVEGVPGIAKTLLVRTLAHVLGSEFGRIQFTPDLMPTDITGTNIFNLKTNEFDLAKGPVFTTFLLADEINRAPAKTQSALLQAMQERQVTIDRKTYPLSANFTVFATQNPIEYEGTYPLPEAQKDRFMLKIKMDYPLEQDELALARRTLGEEAPEAVLNSGQVQPVIGFDELAGLKRDLRAVTVSEELIAYMVAIVRASRVHDSILVGAGPRATQSLMLAGRAAAILAGRDFVTPDDVKSMAGAVLGHRLVLRPEYEIEGLTTQEMVDRILKDIAVPR
ncbi:MAG: MoxR family ATPase [Lentisphaerota bacterium]